MTGSTRFSTTRRIVLKTAAGVAAVGGASGIVGGRHSETSAADDEVSPPADDMECPCDYTRLYEETLDSVVTVRVFDPHGERGTGSGWVYERTGSTAHVVTNWHVVEEAIGADLQFSSGEWRPAASLVGIDPYSDLAVVAVEDVPSTVASLSVRNSPPVPGEEVAALGSPLGLAESITTGHVSALDRTTTIQFNRRMYAVAKAVQTDAAINPGNSGGPLVDCAGQVVGVNFAGILPFVGENVNFAISSGMVERVVPSLLETGRFDHPYVGMQAISLSPMISRVNELDETTEGVYVDGTIAGSPADDVLVGSTATERTTGIPLGGDVVVAIDGNTVGDVDALRSYLFEETRPNETIELDILRNGDLQRTPVTLAAKPLQLERADARGPSL